MMRGRVTYGCYQKMNVLDCVVSSPAEYINLAVRVGTDRRFRELIKARLLEANHVLYEDKAAIQELETFFITAIEKAYSLIPK
jgi:protein O-GlcNAc transferase